MYKSRLHRATTTTEGEHNSVYRQLRGGGVIHGIYGDQGKGCFSVNERGVSNSSRGVFLTVEMGSKILAVKYRIAEKMMSNNCKKTCLVKLRGNILFWALIHTCNRIIDFLRIIM